MREKIQAGVMRLLPITSQHQTTDIFTKAEGPRQFHDCIVKLGMVDNYQPPACEGLLAYQEKEKEITKES